MKYYIFFLLLLSFQGLNSQVRDITAVRITDKIVLDGNLDDVAWDSTIFSEGFTQIEPSPGIASTESTQVKVVYNDEGIYIGAIMNDRSSDKILKELSPRDVIGNVDWFGVILDPYQSGINAFCFRVTAVGVQNDVIYSAEEVDGNWDAIWESEVTITEDGWIAEIKIPYAAIRFPTEDIQNWNIQFVREIRRLRETSYWNPVDVDVSGTINQSGTLSGIKDIKSAVRFSINPFIAGYVQNDYNRGQNINNTSFSNSAGMDIKYGINDAFTLDMALIPDFGQTASDDQVLNLSPFEVYFQENRPFFTEGIELFNKGGLFYSRRVGSRPINYFDAFLDVGSDEVITNNPSQSQLYNATKISGRTTKGMGVGFFNAVAGRSYAKIKNTITGEERNFLTSPLTNYNVIVVDQNLKNNSSISLVNTNTSRGSGFNDANVTGTFLSLKDQKQDYGIDANYVLSNTYGEENQLGHSYAIEVGKISGKYRASLEMNVESDTYEINDLGFLYSNNERSYFGALEYVNNHPKSESITRYNYYIASGINKLYNPNVLSSVEYYTGGFLLGKNRYGYRFEAEYVPGGVRDYFEPRTSDFSKYYQLPGYLSVFGYVSTDYRKTFAIDASILYTSYNSDGRDVVDITLGPRVRVSNQFTILPSITYYLRNKEEGYVGRRQNVFFPAAVTDKDVLIGTRDRKVIENAIELRYIINNKSSLNIRGRHYWDRVKYVAFSVLEDGGELTLIDFDGRDIFGNNAYDNATHFFNIDMNYLWRFAPGSDLIINWKNAINYTNNEIDDRYFASLSNVFQETQQNVVSIKVIYYLDYNQLIKSLN